MNKPITDARQKNQELSKVRHPLNGQQSLTSEEYPSSLENSSLTRKQRQMQQLTEEQQYIVEEYLASIQRKGLKQLLIQRDQLLGELHSINTHLNQMINQLYGDLEEGSKRANNRQNTHPQQLQNQPQKPSLNKNNSNSQFISNVGQVSSPNQKHKPKEFQKLITQQLNLLEQKNQKLIQSLQDQLRDFQYMLTPDYFDQIQQEIFKSQSVKKQLQSEVTLMNKQANKLTKSYDSETLARLEKITYDVSLELTLLNKKLESKVQKLNSIHTQQKQKQTKAQSLAAQEADLERLLQMYEDQQYEGEATSRKKRESCEKLQTKKQKLQKIINSYNTNHLKLYNKKLSDFRDIHEKLQTLDETIKHMEYNIILIIKERKEFEEQNKDILNSHKNVSSTVSQKRKLSLKMVDTFSKDNIQPMTHKKVSEDHLMKRNRLTFIRPLERKQTEQIVPSTEKETPSESRYNQNEIRRRVYTELQNSHYFSSMEKKHCTKSIQTLEEGQNNRYIAQAKTQHKINQRSLIPQSYMQIPTSDKTIIPTEPTLIRRQQKINQKKFNLSNTPLSNHKKENEEQKSFSFYQHDQKSMNELSETNIQAGKNYLKAKETYRKGESHDIEKGSEDEIQKRLIYLENLLKKGETQLIESNQAANDVQETEEKRFQKSGIEINNKKRRENKNLLEAGTGKSSSNSKHSKQMRVKKIGNKSNSEYYKELCKKLGRDKLLIEEDQDISGLIYQGMAGREPN